MVPLQHSYVHYSGKYRHCIGNRHYIGHRHYSAYCHYWLCFRRCQAISQALQRATGTTQPALQRDHCYCPCDTGRSRQCQAIFTGILAGNRHYSTSAIQGSLLNCRINTGCSRQRQAISQALQRATGTIEGPLLTCTIDTGYSRRYQAISQAF